MWVEKDSHGHFASMLVFFPQFQEEEETPSLFKGSIIERGVLEKDPKRGESFEYLFLFDCSSSMTGQPMVITPQSN